MCPPASVVSVDELLECCTDEVVIKYLIQFKSGSPLPLNVFPDLDPYQYIPSNLPADIWYFCSGTKRDHENGFWLSTGEACEIYSTSVIVGLRKTLRFYEGRAPHGQKTNWMMQEYTTIDKHISKPDSRALYRVFLADDSRSGQLSKSELMEMNVEDGTGPSDMANRFPDPPSAMANRPPNRPSAMVSGSPDPPSAMTDRPTNQPSVMASGCPDPPSDIGSGNQLLAMVDRPLIPPVYMADGPPDPVLDNFEDYFLSGDYLGVDDLADPLSRNSSSAVSSCMSMTSDEFFDPVALMRELGDDTVGQEIQDSKIKMNLSAPTKSKEVVVQPTTLESLDSGGQRKPSSEQTSTPQNKPVEHSNGMTSIGVNTTASSSGSEGSSKEEKKDRVGRTKKRKVMKYLCFLAF